jgi:uncharacterized protein YkwD
VTAGWAAGGVLVLAAALLIGSPPPEARGGGGCANARAHPADATLRQMKRALRCLINQKRDRRDRQRLSFSRQLNEAASKHTDKMLARDCFEHRCPGEIGLAGRVRRTGYPDGVVRWEASENIGCATTPLNMFRAWMRKDFTRKNMLKADYRHIGIGAAHGSPTTVDRCQPQDDYITYTAVFGWRRY